MAPNRSDSKKKAPAAVPIGLEKASEIVECAVKEADDVLRTLTDPDKKPRCLKSAVKEAAKHAVMTGDPAKVLQYIKENKTAFISGVYSSVFMSAVRKMLNGGGSASDSGDSKSSSGVDSRPKASEASKKRAKPDSSDCSSASKTSSSNSKQAKAAADDYAPSNKKAKKGSEETKRSASGWKADAKESKDTAVQAKGKAGARERNAQPLPLPSASTPSTSTSKKMTKADDSDEASAPPTKKQECKALPLPLPSASTSSTSTSNADASDEASAPPTKKQKQNEHAEKQIESAGHGDEKSSPAKQDVAATSDSEVGGATPDISKSQATDGADAVHAQEPSSDAGHAQEPSNDSEQQPSSAQESSYTSDHQSLSDENGNNTDTEDSPAYSNACKSKHSSTSYQTTSEKPVEEMPSKAEAPAAVDSEPVQNVACGEDTQAEDMETDDMK